MITVSVAPAVDIKSESTEATRIAVLNFIQSQNVLGATADEVAAAFGSSHNHVAPRITELKKRGLIVATPYRRKTRSGASASVMVAS
jgi:hypothetical protein